jgi:cell division protein FtsB
VVLAVVLVALALSYVYPMRIYLTQQAELAQLRTGQRAQQDRIAELEALAAKWATEDYIRIQARQRLLMVRPGESLLIVEAPPPPGPPAGPAGEQPARPWYETLWTGVQAANGDAG